MKNPIKLLCLAGLFLVAVDHGNAQAPPANYYTLEYWSCTPSSCSNDSSGPVSTGYFETSIKGLCYNGIQPSAKAWSYADNCSPPVLLTSSADATVPGGITVDNIKYQLDGVEAFSAIYDATGSEIDFSDAAMWCDAENHSEQGTPQPCNTPPPPEPPPDRCCACRYAYKPGETGKPALKKTSLCCTCDCPLLIDTSGGGFDLTSAASGVTFDISGTHSPVQMAWTAPGSGDAFLCLPDSTGRCDDGKYLFGNYTPQPASATPNGYLALAVYDLPVNGGNGDGIIDANDAIFSKLRLWVDRNHDGISQPDEIYTLPALGVYSISLTYREDRRLDQYGNLFRYRGQVNPGGAHGGVARTMYDIFLLLGGGTITAQQSCPATPRLLPEGKDGRLR